MPAVDIQNSYVGVGKVLARPYGTLGRRRHVGNVSKIGPAHKLDTKKQPDYTRAGGGTLYRKDRIDAVEVGMEFLSFSPENWALAVAGDATTVATGAVAAETIKGYKDTVVPFASPPSAIASVGALVAGVDYEMSPSGVYFPPGSAVVDGADVAVAYTRAAHTSVEAAMHSGTEMEIFIEGLNEMNSNKAVLFDIWRCLVPAADIIDAIGLDFGKLPFKAEALKDTTKGSGVSAFYRVRIVT
jgi:hypothetical protein